MSRRTSRLSPMTQNRSSGTVTSKVRALGFWPGRDVGLVDGDPVDLEASVGRAAADVVARQTDDALDVVGGLALAGQALDGLDEGLHDPALGHRRLNASGRVEDDDVAAVEAAGGGGAADEDAVADEQGVLHRLARDAERRHEEGPDDDDREQEQSGTEQPPVTRAAA